MSLAAQEEIVITAVGAVSAVGANALNTRMAIKAGIVPFQEHAYVRGTPEDPEWDEDLPINVARVPFIDPFQNDLGRFQAMICPSLAEVLGQSKIKRQDLGATGLLLAAPSDDPIMSGLGLNSAWMQHVQRVTGLGALASAKLMDYGRVGFVVLLAKAAEALRSGKLKHCLVGGIDSYLFEQRLQHYDHHWRVKTERNVDGFVPGEAAAMVMLETRARAQARGATILASVDGLGFGEEEVSLGSTRASSGVGLSTAIRQALASAGPEDLNTVHAGLNGESYFVYEWGVVHTRLGHELANISVLDHPADSVGEIGAALGALLTVNAALQLAKNNSEKKILVFIANDDAGRAALVLKNSEGK